MSIVLIYIGVNNMAKWTSRKLVLSVLFGVGVPVLFKYVGISEVITLTGMALGASYLGANVLDAKKNGTE
jgi:hypothetical protein